MGLTNDIGNATITTMLRLDAERSAAFEKRVIEQLEYQSMVLHDIANTLKAIKDAGPR